MNRRWLVVLDGWKDNPKEAMLLQGFKNNRPGYRL